ncbi:acyl-CoA dehydrogenase [Micromonospora sp. DT44]|uniref:acyl-CoA dehydrogenase C-terminal domain-containing protein n=1 Tax=Micromonospora sp. DT44 TaxID=3393439 RepID=UPI003CECB126
MEQHYRDNRLNPIHEGTHGIQALDLLGRKMTMRGGAGLLLLTETMGETVARARVAGGEIAELAERLDTAVRRITTVTRRLWAGGDPVLALANASAYLEAVGHVVIAWMWLEQVLALPPAESGDSFHAGKRQAARYFFSVELPRTGPQFDLLDSLDRSALDMRADWF